MPPMPFDLFRRRGPAGQEGASTEGRGRAGPSPVGSAAGDGTIAFEALTEEWRLRGTFAASGRLADLLNKREAVPIREVTWAPADASEPFTSVPGLQDRKSVV